MSIKALIILTSLMLASCQNVTLGSAGKTLKEKCEFQKLSEKDLSNITNFTGTSGILITGFLYKEEGVKVPVIINSLDFLDLVRGLKDEQEILQRIKDFRSKAIFIKTDAFKASIGSKFFYYKPGTKNFKKEIENGMILKSYFKPIGQNQYLLDKPPKDINAFLSDLLHENIKIKTGGYLGSPIIECK